ncbi:hypothetical protein MJO28_008417 [Puccinia striiformis f. sp. tritici]|uniref:Uncharacterized protein n=3 Tax=Puccinia striiformis TaxID=27350 RepID=A0A2S4WHE8_9BASI|nr:hypothetical protein MJO28_008417 [Puccinia striiformis f. sp. tritici]KAI9602747.1 hypothetical protein H4Q26_002045 [Puccinia striiformis f. sp. tritici PST-130]POW21182.1 hypothetical protein PSHT_02623 [Puccinia striiformis]
MLSQSLRWIPSSSFQSPNLMARIHSARCVLEQHKVGTGRPAEPIKNVTEATQKPQTADLQPNASPIAVSHLSDQGTFRPSPPPHLSPIPMRPPVHTGASQPGQPGYAPLASNRTSGDQFSPNHHSPRYPLNPQPQNNGQPPFASQNGYNQPFQRPPPSFSGSATQPSWDYRTPPNVRYQPRPENAARFAQRHPPPPYQHGNGFPGANGQMVQQNFPQAYPPSSSAPGPHPPHFSRPPYPPGLSAQPYPGASMSPPPGSFQQGFPNFPTQDNASSLSPVVPRSRRASQPGANLDFDFQDLAGPDALGRSASNRNAPSKPMVNNSSPFPHQPIGHRNPNSADGRSFGRPPCYEPWRNGGPTATVPYPNSPPGSNFSPRNSDWNKGRPGARPGNRSGPNSRSGPRPNHGLRGRGRGAISLDPEPSLPPPPKTILDERGQYGVEPRPTGVPKSIPSSRPPKSLKKEVPIDDYKKIRELIAGSSVPIDLPGFSQPIEFDGSHLLQASQSLDVTWSHGQAQKDQIVKRAFDLVIKNPSLKIDQKKQAVALVDFLLLSREERLAKLKT